MKYLIDTDWIIHHFRQNASVTQHLKKLTPDGMAVSVISLAEIYEGIYRTDNRAAAQQALDKFLSPDLHILGLNHDICKIFGKERSKLRQKGQPIDNLDLFIASTAIHYNLTLLSNNRRHFERVEGLQIISTI